MRALFVAAQTKTPETVEVVERKGLGHPDTICDALAEALSQALCQEYFERFGEIEHHNVDKALLCAGRSAPRFGGGRVLAPMDIYLAGRAVGQVGEEKIPLQEIATESARGWLQRNLHALDAERCVRIHPVLRSGSQELRSLFGRRTRETPVANDTSFGVGYAPMSALEKCILALELRLNHLPRSQEQLAWGEDIKIMGIRAGGDTEIVIACAMVDSHLRSMDDYLAERARIEAIAREEAASCALDVRRISVNAADRPAESAVYLTVTGTSAESGDDGQVGRGNRVNGLITAGRPMSLEAAAGKNPVTHVGKLYNIAAKDIARTIVRTVSGIAGARCLMVSKIGAPITEPALVQVKIETEGAASAQEFSLQIEQIVAEALAALPSRIDDFVQGRIGLY
jgi:S-adenosylmethionine synthetase